MDRIYIRDLALRCIIGIHPDERQKKQDVIITLVLEGDQRPASRSDRLDDAINYEGIKKNVVTFVEDSQFNLLETLAEGVADLVLQERRVRRVTVTVDKPGALRFARSVAVEITREQARPL